MAAALMQEAATLRKALNTAPGVSFGAWQTLPGSNLSRAIARAGFDWVLIDCEHGNISDPEMHESIAAVASVGPSPIVRIAGMESWMVKRALDAGAHGILVPYLTSVAEAQKLVEWSRFPPAGKRGFGSPFSQGAFDNHGRISGQEYFENANKTVLLCVQIETKEALECVEEIAQVPGIDVMFVGPWDLGNNIGHPVKSSFDLELEQAITKIRDAARKTGKKCGIYCANGEDARKFAEDGFQMVACANDMVALPVALAENLSRAKGFNRQPDRGRLGYS